jgi:osmotically-inducible protein OsmY
VLPLLTLLAAAVLLPACNRGTDSTGQKVDGPVAGSQSRDQELKADTRSAASQAQAGVEDAGAKVAQTARDVTITTAVNAKLVADAKLSAMQINVDTTGGRVSLRGTAPDTASRDRATQLVEAVEGVQSVANELTVQPPASR